MRVLDYERPLPEAGAFFVGTQKQGRELHRTGVSCGQKCLKFVSFCVTLANMIQIHDIVSPSEREAIKQKTGNKMKVNYLSIYKFYIFTLLPGNPIFYQKQKRRLQLRAH